MIRSPGRASWRCGLRRSALGAGLLLAATIGQHVVLAAAGDELPSAAIASRITVGPGIAWQPGSVATDGRSVWVGDGSGVARVDSVTGAIVLRASIGANGAAAVGGDEVWISSYSRDAVAPLDPETGIIDRDRLTQVVEPAWLALGLGSLWVATWTQGTVTRIDTATGSLEATIEVPNDGPIATGLGAVWVASTASGGLARIDPAMESVTAVELGLPPSTGVTALTVGPDAVWAADSAANLYRFDPATGAVDTMSAAAGPGLHTPIMGIAASPSEVWLTGTAFTGIMSEYLASPGTLVRVDAASMTITDAWKLDAAANGAVLAGGKLWTAVGFSELQAVGTAGPPDGSALEEGPLIEPLRFEGAVPYSVATDGTSIPMDVYAPRDAAGAPVVVLVPGGPLGFDNRHYLAGLAAALADRGAVVLDVDYRSSATGDSESEAQRDVACAIAWARDHAADFGGDPARIVAAGHSYGGYLLMRSLLAGPDAATCDGRLAPPDAYISVGKIGADKPVPERATSKVPLTLVIGTLDDEYFLAEDFRDRLAEAGYDVHLVVGEGADHFAVIDGRETVPTLDAIIGAAPAPRP